MIESLSPRAAVVVGGGGHASVVVATLHASGIHVVGILDDDESKWDSCILGIEILGPIECAWQLDAQCILAIGDNHVRRRVAERLGGKVDWGIAIHPMAHVHSSVRIGEGTVVFAGAVIQPNTRVGAHAIINTGSSVDHDNLIMDYAHIAPGAHLAGHVTVEEGVFMGIGSVAISGVSIGAWTKVGAGGVVTGNLPAHVTAVGMPARPLGHPHSSS